MAFRLTSAYSAAACPVVGRQSTIISLAKGAGAVVTKGLKHLLAIGSNADEQVGKKDWEPSPSENEISRKVSKVPLGTL